MMARAPAAILTSSLIVINLYLLGEFKCISDQTNLLLSTRITYSKLVYHYMHVIPGELTSNIDSILF